MLKKKIQKKKRDIFKSYCTVSDIKKGKQMQTCLVNTKNNSITFSYLSVKTACDKVNVIYKIKKSSKLNVADNLMAKGDKLCQADSCLVLIHFFFFLKQ